MSKKQETPTRMRPFFQWLYDKTAALTNSTGVRYYELYKHWLIPKVIDLGCGTGATVQLMRANKIEADGIDFVQLDNGMLRNDITLPQCLSYYTSICLDVLPHLKLPEIKAVLSNMQQTKRQILIISTNPNTLKLQKRHIQMHLSIYDRHTWINILSKYINIVHVTTISTQHFLVLAADENH